MINKVGMLINVFTCSRPCIKLWLFVLLMYLHSLTCIFVPTRHLCCSSQCIFINSETMHVLWKPGHRNIKTIWGNSYYYCLCLQQWHYRLHTLAHLKDKQWVTHHRSEEEEFHWNVALTISSSNRVENLASWFQLFHLRLPDIWLLTNLTPFGKQLSFLVA